MFDEADLYRDVTDLHESAHAVIAALLGVPFSHVTARAIGGMRGHLQPRMTPALEEAILRDDARTSARIAIVSCAGPLAEGRDPYGPDRTKAEQFAPDFYDVLLEARNLVADYAPEIHRVAAALSLRNTLSEDDVLALV